MEEMPLVKRSRPCQNPRVFDSAEVYEVRYGWTRKTIVLLVTSLVFCAAPLLLSGYASARVDGLPVPIWLVDVLAVVLGVGGLVTTAAGPVTGRTALRVDAEGVLLGGSPLRYAATTVTVPWAEITTVELWVQRMQVNGRTIRTPYIGVRRMDGAVPVPGTARRIAGRVGTGLTGKDADLIAASRPVTPWRLDQPRLRAALAAHAPGVPLYVEGDFPS